LVDIQQSFVSPNRVEVSFYAQDEKRIQFILIIVNIIYIYIDNSNNDIMIFNNITGSSSIYVNVRIAFG